MTKVKISPTKLKGKLAIPTSKSLAHRAIIAASLAPGESLVTNVSSSIDIKATIEAMKALGSIIKEENEGLHILGALTNGLTRSEIDCKESGSTLRFLIPVSLINENMVHFTGEGKLGSRPLNLYYEIFDKQEITYLYKKDILDLFIQGQLKPGVFEIPGDISSQFITGLLFALVKLDGDSKIIITSPLESKGYLDLTFDVLKDFGIKVNMQDNEIIVPGNQQYIGRNYEVEGDFSQAAFYLVADMLGSDITITNLNLDSHQGDKEIIEILERMGGKLIVSDDGIKMECDELIATDVDASSCPDIIPVLSVAMAYAKGTSRIYNAKRLRYKESDRLKAIYNELKACGVDIEETDDGLLIHGSTHIQGAHLTAYNDHRIAMMEAILATITKTPVYIDKKECVQKSYPHFFEDYKKLGGIVDEC